MKVYTKDIDNQTFEERAFDVMTMTDPFIMSIKRDGSFPFMYVVYYHFHIPLPQAVLVAFKANDEKDCQIQIDDFTKVEPDSPEKHKQYFGEGSIDKAQALFAKARTIIIGKIPIISNRQTTLEEDAMFFKKWAMELRKKFSK